MQTPRPIRPGEEPLVHALIDRCYREYGLVLNLADECEQHLKDPGAYFRAHGGEFWVLLDGEAIVGTVAMTVDGDLAELKSMYVSPERRRRGLGRMLTTHVIDAARRAGCGILELWSDTRFRAAHAMYEALGFARFGERDIVDSNASREFGYRRSISAP